MSEYNSGKRTKMSDDDLQSVVKNAVTEAIDFIESDIAPDRNKSQRYVEGEVDIGHEEGRSKVVSTKVRDTIRTIMPKLMRVFLASRMPVEFMPRRPDQVQGAEEATEYIMAEFERLNGFEKLVAVFNDALSKKNGFIKCYWDDIEEVETIKYSNLTDDELAYLEIDDDLEIVDLETETEEREPPQNLMPMPDPQTGQPAINPETGQPVMVDPETGEPWEAQVNTHSCTVERADSSGSIAFDTLPPEDFFIDSGATCFDDALVYGHQTELRVTDLVEMGFDYEDVVDLGSINTDTDTSDEKYEREDYTTNDLMSRDPSMKLVTVTEAYMKVDMDGTGHARMHKFILGGRSYKMLDYELWSGESIAVFEADPRAHLFFGWSIADILFNDQDASTSMLRGILDNIALTNDPRTEVNDEVVNMDDLLNNEIGNVVRTTQMGNINPLTVPFVAGETLPAVQYFDGQVEAKTGINQTTGGFNADLLQTQTAAGVMAATQEGANQIESIARNLACGMRSLFSIMLKLVIENSDEEVMMRMAGNRFVPLEPRSWDLGMDMGVNVGLGTGRDAEKMAALQGALTIQEKMMQQGSPMVTPDNVFNTLDDMLSLAGIRDAARYFTPVPPPDPNAPPAPEQPNPIIEGEKIRAQAKMESDKMDNQTKMITAKKDDDLKRDQMAQDLFVDMQELQAKYGLQADTAMLKAAQDAQRDADGRAMSQQEAAAQRQQQMQIEQMKMQQQQGPQQGQPQPPMQ